LVYARAFGTADKGTGRRLVVRDLFRIASIAKPITAVAVMKLVEQGKLALSDTVFGSDGVLGTTYGTTRYGANVDKITVQHLLEHTAGGWANDGNDPMFSNLDKDHAGLISRVLDNRTLDNAPGASHAYSNFGYCVLGRVIEKASGQSYASYVQQHVLGAAGIGNMHLAGDTLAARRADEVVYYSQKDEDSYGMKVARMDAHGGWLASAVDLVRFAVRCDGLATKPDILSAASITTTTTASTARSTYCKGWALHPDGNWFHDGSLPGTASIMVRTGTGLCWAAIVNTRRRPSDLEGDLDRMMWNLIGKVGTWPAYDLF